jgi:hypothetical protein
MNLYPIINSQANTIQLAFAFTKSTACVVIDEVFLSVSKSVESSPISIGDTCITVDSTAGAAGINRVIKVTTTPLIKSTKVEANKLYLSSGFAFFVKRIIPPAKRDKSIPCQRE